MAKPLLMNTLRPLFQKWTEGVKWPQVETQVLDGNVTLTDLHFNRQALEDLLGKHLNGLDVSVVSGNIGTVKASWNWSCLFSTVTTLEVDTFHLDVRVRKGHKGVGHQRVATPVQSRPARRWFRCCCRKAKKEGIEQESANAAGRRKRAQMSIATKICDSLNIKATSISASIVLLEDVALRMSLDADLQSGRSPGAQIQSLHVQNMVVCVEPTPQPTVDADWQRGRVLNPTSFSVEFYRSSGRRFVDLLGLTCTASLEDVKLWWSQKQNLAIAAALLNLKTAERSNKFMKEVRRAGEPLPLTWLPCSSDLELGADDIDDMQDLSASDMKTLQEAQAAPSSDAVFEIKASVRSVAVRFSDSANPLLTDESPIVIAELGDFTTMFQKHAFGRHDATCTLRTLRLLDGESQDASSSPLFALRRTSTPDSLGLDISGKHCMAEPSQINIHVGSLDVRVSPRWADCAKLGLATLEQLRELKSVDAQQEKKLECTWSLQLASFQVIDELGRVQVSSGEDEFRLRCRASVEEDSSCTSIRAGSLELPTVVVDSSEEFVRQCQEIAKLCSEQLQSFSRNKCVILEQRPFGLQMRGDSSIVESVTHESARTGVSTGCELLSVGRETIGSASKIPLVLGEADLPVLLRFRLPESLEPDISLELVVESFLLRVDGFKAKTNLAGKGTFPRVTLNRKGTPTDLRKELSKSYLSAVDADTFLQDLVGAVSLGHDLLTSFRNADNLLASTGSEANQLLSSAGEVNETVSAHRMLSTADQSMQHLGSTAMQAVAQTADQRMQALGSKADQSMQVHVQQDRGSTDTQPQLGDAVGSSTLKLVHLILRQYEGHPCVRLFDEDKPGARIVAEIANETKMRLLQFRGDFAQVRSLDEEIEGWVGCKNCDNENSKHTKSSSRTFNDSAAPHVRRCAVCSRPASYGFSHCCRTCEGSNGRSHGPRCNTANGV